MTIAAGIAAATVSKRLSSVVWTASAALIVRTIKPASIEIGGEQRPLDERQVSPLSVFFSLSDDKFRVGQGLNDSADLDRQLACRVPASMPVGDLIDARPVRMRANEDR